MDINAETKVLQFLSRLDMFKYFIIPLIKMGKNSKQLLLFFLLLFLFLGINSSFSLSDLIVSVSHSNTYIIETHFLPISVIVYDPNSASFVDNAFVEVRIYDPNNNLVYYTTSSTNNVGIVNFYISDFNPSIMGQYIVNVRASKNGLSGQTTNPLLVTDFTGIFVRSLTGCIEEYLNIIRQCPFLTDDDTK